MLRAEMRNEPAICRDHAPSTPSPSLTEFFVSTQPESPTPLSVCLPGTWQLLSRIDRTASGERRIDPSLGEDPIALLIYDRSGHFAAQFMKRDCTAVVEETSPAAEASNNSQPAAAMTPTSARTGSMMPPGT